MVEEGLFFKAYEESACRLAQQYGFKVSCREVKTVGEMVASVGFPKHLLTLLQQKEPVLWVTK